MTIWLIGGTGESREIATVAIADLKPLISVTTPEAKALYPADAFVVVGKMNPEAIKTFCLEHSISAIVDASHPFAVLVSENAIAIAQELDIPYLRYERREIPQQETSNCLELESFGELLQGEYLLNQRVLLTVGCNALPQFRSWHDRAMLFARVLPKLDSLSNALESGFTSDRLIALRPPISPELEKALLQKWQISLIVTKASGSSGGEDIKRKLAQGLGIKLITIARPKVSYPQQTNDLEEVRRFCLLASRRST